MNVNAIRSSSVDPWSSPDGDTPPATTTPKPTVPRDTSSLPDLPDVHAGLLARATQSASTPHPLLATGLKAADLEPTLDSETRTVMARLDAFMQAAKPTYHIPGEGDVAVAVPFRLWSNPPGYPQQEKVVQSHAHEREVIARASGIPAAQIAAIPFGRGTPESIHKLTQALIDAGKLPPPSLGETPTSRVRHMMCDWRIGLDCAGYTQQAFLAAHALTRAKAGFDADVTQEGLFNLPTNSRFSRVAPSDASSGDIIALDHPPQERFGHRVMVFEHHPMSQQEISQLRGSEDDRALLRSGRVSVFLVDSSWGAGGDPDQGGAYRAQWVHDAASDRWGRIVNNVVWFNKEKSSPYDGHHPLIGIYRIRETSGATRGAQ
jgi:hypothetical protein